MRTFSLRIPASLAFALVATQAFAHAQLEKATPAVGGTVGGPSEIRLEFSEGVEPKFSKVSLSGPGGAVPLGAAKTDLQTPVCRRLQGALAGRFGRHASHPGNL
jgi:copper resistance protein C